MLCTLNRLPMPAAEPALDSRELRTDRCSLQYRSNSECANRVTISRRQVGRNIDMEQMEHDDQPTCGKGLAASADLPAKFAELMAARAEVLKRHTKALDLTDPHAQAELDAYTELERAHHSVASELASLAEAMASYRDLPMARHDMAVMTDPKGQMEAFQQFVTIERELLTLLQANLEAEEELLQ